MEMVTDKKQATWLNLYYWWTCSNCFYAEDNHPHEVCPKCGSLMTNGKKLHWMGKDEETK